MSEAANTLEANQIITDDLAFSAWLKMKGHTLMGHQQKRSKSLFTFEIESEDAELLKVEFVNSEFLKFYNEVRNLKKIL